MIKRTFRLTSWHCCQTMRQSTTLTFNETSNGKRLLLTTWRATSKLHTVQQAKASTRRKTRSVERGASCTTYRMQSSGANRTLPADKNTHQDTPILAAPRCQLTPAARPTPSRPPSTDVTVSAAASSKGQSTRNPHSKHSVEKESLLPRLSPLRLSYWCHTGAPHWPRCDSGRVTPERGKLTARLESAVILTNDASTAMLTSCTAPLNTAHSSISLHLFNMKV